MDTEVNVREAMTLKVETVAPEVSVLDAAKQMVKKKIGCIVVVEDGKPVGIVTEWDFCKSVVAKDKKPSQVKVKEIMTISIRTVSPEMNLTEASKVMAKYNIRRLPVIEKGSLVGIITNKDIMAISPEQIAILKELSTMKEAVGIGKEAPERGTCEVCGEYGVKVFEVDGVYVCESCREDRMVEE